MAVTCGFFDAIDHDRTYNAEDFGSLFDGVIKDGILNSYGSHFEVTRSTGLDIIVGSGKGWFKNTWIKNDDNLTLTAEPNITEATRIDTVVIDVDKRDSVRANNIIIVQGTTSRPVLIDEAAHKQYPLADITIDATGSTITAVTDRRTESYAAYLLSEQLRPYWPIGSIYMSVNNIEPSTLFGGTWEQISGRFLIGCGGSSGLSNGDTGGTWEHTLTVNQIPQHTHSISLSADSAYTGITLASANMAIGESRTVMGWAQSKDGYIDQAQSNYIPSSWDYPFSYRGGATATDEMPVQATPNITNQTYISDPMHSHTISGNTGISGAGQAITIKPPYLAVYMWKRVG